MPLPLLTIALPIGVSFYTFQAITYVVDVKRREAEPASLIDAAIYLSFFPHLIAGPIVRASEFLPQLKAPRDPNKVAVAAGLALIALGLIKKVALADYLGRTVVDPVFGVPQAYDAPDALVATYAYAAQIYCDFSGYIDIAIGLALLLGFVFPLNFNCALPRDRLSRFLAPLEHDPLALPARLPLHPAGRKPRRALAHLPQPDDHDGPRRAVARGGVDVRALGRLPRRRAGERARARGADRPPHPDLAALVRHLQPRLLRVDPVPLHRPLGRRRLPVALRRPGAATVLTLPVALAIGSSIGAQLLPPRPLERLRSASRACARRSSRRRWSLSSCSSAPPSPARACRRSSTSSSDS